MTLLGAWSWRRVRAYALPSVPDEVTPVVAPSATLARTRPSEEACGEVGAVPGEAVITGIFDAGTYTAFADARERESAGHYMQRRPETSLPEVSGRARGIVWGYGAARPGERGGCPHHGRHLRRTGRSRRQLRRSRRRRRRIPLRRLPSIARSLHAPGRGSAPFAYRVETLRRPDVGGGLRAWHRRGARPGLLLPRRGRGFAGGDGQVRHRLGTPRSVRSEERLHHGRTPRRRRDLRNRHHAAGAGDRFSSSCLGGDTGVTGPDRVFRLVLVRRSTVKIRIGVNVRCCLLVLRSLATPRSKGNWKARELACDAETDAVRRTTVERQLDAGTYWVVVDGATSSDEGGFSLEYRILH